MTTYRHGQFVWRELNSTDVDASRTFYSEVFGWKFEPMGAGPDGGTYWFAKLGDAGVAGLSKHPKGGPAYWGTAVSVDNVDEVAKRVKDAGGTIIVEPQDAGGMGRFTYFFDKQGGVTSAWKGTPGDGEVNQPPKVGEFCWEQLNTNDADGSFAFYEKVFGWTHAPYPNEPGLAVFSAGSVQVASVLENKGIPTHWLSYIVVDTIASAYERVKKQGGKVMVDHIEVKGIGAIGVIADNVGAVVGVFEQPTK